MYIIIIGGGEAGYHLSKALLKEGHEVLVIENDARKIGEIEEELGSICMQGDGCEVTTLDEAGAERANLFIAVTGKDEDNLVACQVARHKFNVPRIIARVNQPENEALFKKLGIDVTINSTNLIMEHIEQEVPTHPLTHLLTLRSGDLEVVEVRIPPTSPAVGKRISELSSELSLPMESILSLIIRKERTAQLPTPDTILEADDRVIAVIKRDSEEALRLALAGER